MAAGKRRACARLASFVWPHGSMCHEGCRCIHGYMYTNRCESDPPWGAGRGGAPIAAGSGGCLLGPLSPGHSCLKVHVRILDVDGNHYAASDKDTSKGSANVIYEFDVSGGSSVSGAIGSTYAPGLGNPEEFDYKNVAERIYLRAERRSAEVRWTDIPVDQLLSAHQVFFVGGSGRAGLPPGDGDQRVTAWRKPALLLFPAGRCWKEGDKTRGAAMLACRICVVPA